MDVFNLGDEEKGKFVNFINGALGENESVSHLLPLDPTTDDLYEKVGDGFIFGGLLKIASPDALNIRALQKPVITAYGEAPLSDEQKKGNLLSVLTAAKSLGFDFPESNHVDCILDSSGHDIILAFIAQCIRMVFCRDVSVKNYPELVLLLDDDEEMGSLLFMTTEEILFRWVNYHLAKANDYRGRRLKHWNEDLKDCEVYGLLLRQLIHACDHFVDPSSLDFGYTCRLTLEEKAATVIKVSVELGVVSPLISKENILSGSFFLNVVFMSQLFVAVTGLSLNQHVREHVKESIDELIKIREEEEKQEKMEKERIEKEEKEKAELEIALEKERQYRKMLEEEELQQKKRDEEMAIALEKEKQHRELLAAEERIEKERAEAMAEAKKREEEEKLQEAIAKEEEEKTQSSDDKHMGEEEKGHELGDKNDEKQEECTVDSDKTAQAIVSEDGSSLSVVDEAWENQTYLPVRGWGAPRSSMHLFSDRSGSKKVVFEKYPDVPGWEWEVGKDWEVDHSKSFGDTDEEGWCYDSSFEKIFEALKLGMTSGEKKTTSLARRRRLLRTRVCTSQQAVEDFESNVAYLRKEKILLDAAVSDCESEFNEVVRYEEQRDQLQSSAKDVLLETLTIGCHSFIEFREELTKLKEFLQAQADAEFRYAEKLESLFKEYSPRVNTDDAPRRRSATTSDIVNKTREYLHLKEDSASVLAPDSGTKPITENVKKASFQFFSGFSEFNSSSANKYRDFGNFIQESVMSDVSILEMEVNEAIKEAKLHMKFEENHKQISANIKNAFVSLRRANQVFVRKNSTKLSVLQSRIGNGEKNSGNYTTVGDTEKNNESNTAPPPELLTLKSNSSGFDFDFHLCFSKYKALANEFTHELDLLQQAAVKCSEQSNNFSLKIRQIFVISMQLFCHEKAKICSHISGFMKETSDTFQLWNNAVNDKEFKEHDATGSDIIHRKSSSACSDVTNEDEDADSSSDATVLKSPTVTILPSIALEPLGSKNLILQNDMQFTTLRDARRASQGELDDVSPMIVRNASDAKINFGGKSSWLKSSTKVEDSSNSAGSNPHKSSINMSPVKNRFTNFFTKHKDKKAEDHGLDSSTDCNEESEAIEQGERRKSLVGNEELPEESSHEPTETIHFYCGHVVATCEGALHIYAQVEEQSEDDKDHSSISDTRSPFDFGRPPIKSISLEDCKVIHQDNPSSKNIPQAIEIYPQKNLSGKRVSEGIVLLPVDKEQALKWLSVLCSPICGASLLVPLAGTDLEVASYGTDLCDNDIGEDGLDTSFIVYGADSLKPCLD